MNSTSQPGGDKMADKELMALGVGAVLIIGAGMIPAYSMALGVMGAVVGGVGVLKLIKVM